MKISTKGRYGMRILIDLALHEGTEPRMLRDIAKSQGLSEKYLSRLIIELRQAGMVESVRGAKGGYHLARDPKRISLLEIIEVMEGPIGIVNCVYKDNKKFCDRIETCGPREVLALVNEKIRQVLADSTLQDMLDRQAEIDIDAVTWNFCI